MGPSLASLLLAELCTAAAALHSSGERVPRRAGAERWAALETLDSPDTDIHRPDSTTAPPHSLHGKNLLLVGDSNDRKASRYMCNKYGGEVKIVSKMPCGEQTLTFPSRRLENGPVQLPSASSVCHIPAYNLSIMFFFHFGAVTMPPEPKWHSDMLRNSSYPFQRHLPTLPSGNFVSSPTELVCFWRSAMARQLPRRPSVLVAQSSLWDSTLAKFFLDQRGSAEVLLQEGLEEVGWKRTAQLDAWAWMEHSSALMESLRDGLGVQELYWRTNPNCPLEDAGGNGPFNGMIDAVSSAQADAVRKACGAREGIWSQVTLIDWRKQFVAVDGDCDYQHYTSRGLESYVDLLEQVLDDKASG